uniref:nuclear pore complex protein Nup50 n=1 Tax=Myxine glutinosa TaxID=7769 RepID=UPI00358EE6B0
MASKRPPINDLNDRNWNDEELPEEAGKFASASAEVLKSRTIKKARRRNPESSGTSRAFKEFTGLLPSLGSSSMFGSSLISSPLANGCAGLTPSFSNCSGTESSAFAKTSFTTGSSTANTNGSGKSPATLATISVCESEPEPELGMTCEASPGEDSLSTEYKHHLRSLNCAVRDWISSHVDRNPLCDLTPVFHDYKEHLAVIEQKHGKKHQKKTDLSTFYFGKLNASGFKASNNFSFSFALEGKDKPSGISSFNLAAEKKSPSIGQANIPKTGDDPGSTTLPPTFSFVRDGSNDGTSPLISFTPKSQPFTFSTTSTQKPSTPGDNVLQEGQDEEENTEPPKPIVNQVNEEKAFYSKKCKLFYKKDGEYREKGIGMLHLKPAGEKTQMVVRADTNLGNVLLNIILQSSLPCSRTGKNNVLIVCVPNPPIDEKGASVSMLIRVKTAEEADELHQLITEKKDILKS